MQVKRVLEAAGWGHYISPSNTWSIGQVTGNTYNDPERNVRKTVSTLAVIGAGTIVYGAYEFAQAVNLV